MIASLAHARVKQSITVPIRQCYIHVHMTAVALVWYFKMFNKFAGHFKLESNYTLLRNKKTWVKWIKHKCPGNQIHKQNGLLKQIRKNYDTMTVSQGNRNLFWWQQKQFSKWLICRLILNLAVFVQGEEKITTSVHIPSYIYASHNRC